MGQVDNLSHERFGAFIGLQVVGKEKVANLSYEWFGAFVGLQVVGKGQVANLSYGRFGAFVGREVVELYCDWSGLSRAKKTVYVRASLEPVLIYYRRDAVVGL